MHTVTAFHSQLLPEPSPQAAALAGASLRVRGNLLRELLSSSGAFGLLLGGGGPGGESGAAHC